LQQESADKEVKIVQLGKQRSQDKEDLQGLNIALDSKQQELELLKRRLGVRGTAGSTPAQPSKIPQQRRDSAVFTTPSMSRPPSVISDSGKDSIASIAFSKEHKAPLETPVKLPALGKSGRTNSTGTILTSTTSKSTTGSMGPPMQKPRTSTATPTPTPKATSLSRSSGKPPVSTPIAAPHRRGSSVTLGQSQSRMKISRQGINPSPAPSVSESGEKENIDAPDASRRISRVLTPA